MKTISWYKFIKKPRLTLLDTDEKREIEHADEIVTLVKSFDRIIGELRIQKGVDFSGCSPDYVVEKIDLTILSLEWIKQRIKEIK